MNVFITTVASHHSKLVHFTEFLRATYSFYKVLLGTVQVKVVLQLFIASLLQHNCDK